MLRLPYLREHEYVGAQYVLVVAPVGNQSRGHHRESLRRVRVAVAAGALPVAQAPGGRSSRAKPGGFVPIKIETSMTPRAGCTVVIAAQLRLECATLPGVDWLAALSAALAERGLNNVRLLDALRGLAPPPRPTDAHADPELEELPQADGGPPTLATTSGAAVFVHAILGGYFASQR